jgi:hypothetical protein
LWGHRKEGTTTTVIECVLGKHTNNK